MQRLRLHAMRAAQRLGAPRATRLCPRRVLFLHIPKTAGSTVNGYFKARLGTSWSGQVCTLRDDALADPARLALARRARFVGGHFGAETLAEIRGDAFLFTFLRDPLDRLLSAWRYYQSARRDDLWMPFERLEDALRSDHPRVIAALDNVMTRQLGSTAEPLALPGADGTQALAAARATLESCDFVGRTESFDADFLRLLAELGLPPPAEVGRRNVTEDPTRRSRAAARPLPPVPPRDELEELVAPWIRWDRKLMASTPGS